MSELLQNDVAQEVEQSPLDRLNDFIDNLCRLRLLSTHISWPFELEGPTEAGKLMLIPSGRIKIVIDGETTRRKPEAASLRIQINRRTDDEMDACLPVQELPYGTLVVSYGQPVYDAFVIDALLGWAEPRLATQLATAETDANNTEAA